MKMLNLAKVTLRELNSQLQNEKSNKCLDYTILNPEGAHALAVGLDRKINITINGSTGYYCGGMNKKASINVMGSVGPGVAENMMSGKVIVEGNASQYAGATGHGGTLVIKGNASSRCGISMKGINILVQGNVGHMSAFMAQSGNLIIGGNVGDSLGDSIYEAHLFVRGSIKSLGTDCIEKEMRKNHIVLINQLLAENEIDGHGDKFRRYGSARKLYNFNVDNLGEY